MAEEKTILSLDLDADKFMEKAAHAAEAIHKIGEAESLKGLAEGVSKVSGLIGVLGAAAFGLKMTWDAVFESESIRAVDSQFEHLTRSVGLAGDALKESLVETSKGLVTENELLKSANKAIVEMGLSANKLGEVLAVARTQTAIMGGDLIQNFEAINQAIATGHTRALRHIGIIVDQDKAYRDYARTLGITVSAMSQEEKQQAVLNAVLEAGKKNTDGIGASVKENTTAWKQLKVTLTEIGEIATVVYGKFAGPAVKSALTWLKDWFHEAKIGMVERFGSGASQAAAHVEHLKIKIAAAKEEIKKLEETQAKIGKGDPAFLSTITKNIENYRQNLIGLTTDLRKAEKAIGERPEEAGVSPEQEAKRKAANDKRLAQETKFQKDLETLRLARIQSEEAAAKTIEQMEYAFGEKRVAIREQFDAQIAQVRAQGALGHEITEQQASQLIVELEAQKAAKLIAMEEEVTQARITARQRELQYSNSVMGGIAAQAHLSAAQATRDWQNSGKLGGAAMRSFENQSVAALQGWASGTKTAAEAAKGFMFGMIGDVATAQGKVMMLDAFKTFPAVNVGEFGAGAALVALGAFLSSQGGGGGAGGPSVGVGGGGAAPSDLSGGMAAPAAPAQVAEKKAVSINVSGHFFETEQTKIRLVEMIRESSDATDFTIKSIGS